MRLAIVVAELLLVAACGFPALADGADGGTDDASADASVDAPPEVPCDGSCALYAIDRAIANTGDVLVLEGTFGATAAVTFPGGATAAASVLGSHRATVVVPAAATAGDLTVSTNGMTTAALPFRRASFALGVGTFALRDEQVDRARAMPHLTTGRFAAGTATTPTALYEIGGYGGGYLKTVEMARLDADGAVGPFTPGPSLTVPRASPITSIVGDRLYAIGGDGSGGPLASIEHAPIAADGSLGAFVADPVGLALARTSAAGAIVGDSVYVIGGYGGGAAVASIERARILADGSLGPFVTSARSLVVARTHPAALVIGASLYVFGGDDADGWLASVERADLAPDGTLGAFAVVPGLALASPRSAPRSALRLGDAVYVVGGHSASSDLATVERATILGDGSLAPFAIASTTLRVGREYPTIAVVGNWLYVLGGRVGSSDQTTIERASLDASGGLGAFTTVTGTALAKPRNSQSSAISGAWLALAGGDGGTGDLKLGERASIARDGTLGTFATTSTSQLVTARDSHAIALVGNFAYVLGGTSTTASVEVAPIAQDGTIGAFATSGVALTGARVGGTAAVIGNFLYYFGGRVSGATVATVERAAINSDGSLGAFATVAGVTLATARNDHASLVCGDFVYAIGGSNGSANYLTSVERAPINSDGSIGTFAIVTGVSLATPRLNLTLVVVGSSLYAIAGLSSSSPTYSGTVERAVIAADGTLGPFTVVPGVTLQTPRFAQSTTVIGNRVFVIGGAGPPSGGTPGQLGSIEQATLE